MGNDEYMPPEERIVHAEIPAKFPGMIMDKNDEDCDPALGEHDKTEEEQVRQVSQTTGVPAHDTKITGVQGALGTDPTTTTLVTPKNNNNEGVDEM